MFLVFQFHQRFLFSHQIRLLWFSIYSLLSSSIFVHAAYCTLSSGSVSAMLRGQYLTLSPVHTTYLNAARTRISMPKEQTLENQWNMFLQCSVHSRVAWSIVFVCVHQTGWLPSIFTGGYRPNTEVSVGFRRLHHCLVFSCWQTRHWIVESLWKSVLRHYRLLD